MQEGGQEAHATACCPCPRHLAAPVKVDGGRHSAHTHGLNTNQTKANMVGHLQIKASDQSPLQFAKLGEVGQQLLASAPVATPSPPLLPLP